MPAKKKILGGKQYLILGSTIERDGFNVVCKKYTVPTGVVVIKNGKVKHTDGSVTDD